MIQTRTIALPSQRINKDGGRPTITKWKGESMIRVHSIRAAAKEIVRASKNRDVIKVGFIGEPDTGKSTQSDLVGHLIHTMAEIPYAIRSFKREALLDIEKTLSDLEPANYVLKFGDVSWLGATANKKKIEELKKALSEIRHLPGGGMRDVKIVLIYDYHYTKALDPYLRQSEFKFFTGIGSSEKKNMEEMAGQKYLNTMYNFKKMCSTLLQTEKFTFPLGNKGYFTYKFKEPFIPMLFWNEVTMRYVVSPRRQWIDPLCSTCDMAGGAYESEIPIDQFVKESEAKFGEKNFQSAVKLTLLENGINVYSPAIANAKKYYAKATAAKKISHAEVAAHYGFEESHSRLRKKLDGVLSDDP